MQQKMDAFAAHSRAPSIPNATDAQHMNFHRPPPIITEYCDHPDLDSESGWQLLMPNDAAIAEYGPCSRPIEGYVRRPPNLMQYGTQRLIGRTIERMVRGLGTHGTGGCGWLGLELRGEPSAMLIYCLWGANDWVTCHRKANGNSSTSVSGWKIESVAMAEREIRIHCRTEEGDAAEVSANETLSRTSPLSWIRLAHKFSDLSGATYTMGELWHCCRADGEHWS
jgi:hypothetical protein